ncbi:MAG: hypothetical protein ACTHK1_07950 [Actinomycetales bacterium]
MSSSWWLAQWPFFLAHRHPVVSVEGSSTTPPVAAAVRSLTVTKLPAPS